MKSGGVGGLEVLIGVKEFIEVSKGDYKINRVVKIRVYVWKNIL